MIALSVSLDRAKPRSLIAAIAAKKDKTYITALIKMPADMDFFEAYGKIKEVFGRLSNMVKSRRVLIEEPASTAAAKIVAAQAQHKEIGGKTIKWRSKYILQAA